MLFRTLREIRLMHASNSFYLLWVVIGYPKLLTVDPVSPTTNVMAARICCFFGLVSVRKKSWCKIFFPLYFARGNQRKVKSILLHL